MELKNRRVLEVKDYKNRHKTSLYNAYDIVENTYFGEMQDLSFKLPYYQYDGYGNVVTDDNGDKINNLSMPFVIAENLIKLDDYYYIIKKVTTIQHKDGNKALNIDCLDKASNLSKQNIAYLDLTPLEFNPVQINAAIINVLTIKHMILEGTATGGTANTVTLPATASATDDIYNTNKVAILDGTGQGQDYRIIDYNGSTKVATIEGNFNIVPDTTSIIRVHKSKWTLGEVNTDFLETELGVAIKRTFLFEGKSITQCFIEIIERIGGYYTFNYEYSDVYDEFIHYINVVKPRLYDNTEFRYKKNLQGVERVIDSNETTYTVVYPYGDNDLTINNIATETRTDNGVTYNTHTNGLSYIENYQYYLSLDYTIDECRDLFFFDYEINDTMYVDDGDLYADAKADLDKKSNPKITYALSVIDLGRMTGYDYEIFEKGDTIKVYDDDLGLNFFATIIKKPISENSPHKSEIEISNRRSTLSDYIVDIINVAANNR